MEDNTEDQPDLFAEDFLVSPTAWHPGTDSARKMTVRSGQKCLGLLKRSGRTGLLSKMLLESSIWNSTRCYLNWEVKATPQKFLFCQLAPKMHGTSETEFLFWPTPTTREYKGARSQESMAKTGRNPMTNTLSDAVEAASEYSTENGKLRGSLNPEFCEWLMGFQIGYTELKP